MQVLDLSFLPDWHPRTASWDSRTQHRTSCRGLSTSILNEKHPIVKIYWPGSTAVAHFREEHKGTGQRRNLRDAIVRTYRGESGQKEIQTRLLAVSLLLLPVDQFPHKRFQSYQSSFQIGVPLFRRQGSGFLFVNDLVTADVLKSSPPLWYQDKFGVHEHQV